MSIIVLLWQCQLRYPPYINRISTVYQPYTRTMYKKWGALHNHVSLALYSPDNGSCTWAETWCSRTLEHPKICSNGYYPYYYIPTLVSVCLSDTGMFDCLLLWVWNNCARVLLSSWLCWLLEACGVGVVFLIKFVGLHVAVCIGNTQRYRPC
jgi:hypothetical protein